MSSVSADGTRRPGERLGRYRLLRVLGSGGMGTVYLAEDEERRQVAIKEIHPKLSARPEFRERFRREVKAARRVRPFCTAPVLDADVDGERLFVVTEYIPGPTLEETVMENGPLRGADLEALAVGVAAALSAIHGAGVVHRDLKPANILLSPFGPRVIDFGIARTLETDGRMTQTGETMGTPSFMAPEGLIGRPVTTAADVFTWGCVVVWAATGLPPFPGDNVGEILYRTVYGEPQLEGLAPEMRRIVERATAKDPSERPDAAELLRMLTGEPDPANAARFVTLPPAANRRSEPMRRRRGWTHDGRTLLTTLRNSGLWRTAARRRAAWAVTALCAAAAVGATALMVLDAAGGPPAAEQHLFDDDFSDRSKGWNEGGISDYFHRYENGGYTISQNSTDEFGAQAAPVSALPPRLLIGAKVRVVSQEPRDEGGLYCRDDGTARFEVVLARDGHIAIRRTSGRNHAELGRSADAAASPGAAAEIRMLCETSGGGTRVRAWVDGHEVAEGASAEGPLTGRAGLLAGRPGRRYAAPASVAFFDDVTIDRA
ncbi:MULTISPECIES: serine/threonine-protein kinase [unclassified Actinomadura]|uniref:serine/threonine-protein kinase n=1 Tax=unclassified Actinomadura TaxID=2626254 RepID=UPI0011EBEC4B|nr:serine/threonine-protein kinase [Actinomadura sp. K4S16]